MERNTTTYKFIGTASDAKKYPDPEPIIGKEYNEEEFLKIANSVPLMVFRGTGMGDHWEEIVKTEPIPVHEVLTKFDRIEILKIFLKENEWPLYHIENYIAFGKWPK